MSIFLVQHALSLPEDIDPDKGISDAGLVDTERIAGVARGYRVRVAKIIHSGKKRARQTAEIFARELSPESGVEVVSGLNPLDNVREFAPTLTPLSNLMVIGHLPHLERLTAWMVAGRTDHPVFRFQNSGIVCLDKAAEENFWSIKWTLMPNIS